MNNKITVDPAVTLTPGQLQAIIANERSKSAVTYERSQTYARAWRIAEAKVNRLRRENRKLRKQRSVFRSPRTLVDWASQPSRKQKGRTIPGFEMELTVFGLLMASGMASIAVSLL